ncbi:MAG: hypothetical protein AB7P14_04115 [Blastocatellales bacterium]
MENRNLSFLLVPLVAAIAFILPMSSYLLPSASQNNPAASQSSANKTSRNQPTNDTQGKTKPEDGKTEAIETTNNNATRLVCNFLGKPIRPNGSGKEACLNKLGQMTEIRFLLATLPDPVNPRLNYNFDRYLDAIQRAAEAAGFLLDSFDLPSIERANAKTGDSAARNSDKLPGVLLFRSVNLKDKKQQQERDNKSSDKPISLLEIFLVSENPTAGINKEALKSALDQITLLSPRPRSTSDPLNIPILGPSFSGSAISLQIALADWKPPVNGLSVKFDIVSGSATNPFVKTILESGNKAEGKKEALSFHSTVIPDDAAMAAFTAYLKQQEPNPSYRKIALLTEANTSYGRQFSKEEGEKQSTDDKSDYLKIPFPLHISQLRNEYEKARSNQDNTAINLAKNQNQLLSLPLQTDEEAKDVIPLFSAQLESASSEIVLASLLDRIRSERAKYVGILATDIRDRLFLAQELRKHCPNVIIFILNADLLYLHYKARLTLQGTLVITPYPLFIANQTWTSTKSDPMTRLQFPTQTTQGIYNATMALLDRQDLMLEYGKPFENPANNRQPSLWLCEVGSNGFWPVKLLDYADKQKVLYTASQQNGGSPVAPEKFKYDWELSSLSNISPLIFLSLLCLITSFYLFRNRDNRKAGLLSIPGTRRKRNAETSHAYSGKHNGVLHRFFSSAVDEPWHNERQLYLLAWSADILSMYLLFCFVLFLPLFTTDHTLAGIPWWAGLLLAANIIVLIIAAGKGNLRSWYPNTIEVCTTTLKIKAPVKKWSFLILGLAFVTLLPLISIILMFLYFMTLSQMGKEESAFFVLRSLNLTSGVSPVLPLLLVGIAGLLWLICTLRRLRMCEQMAYLPPGQKKKNSFLNYDGWFVPGIKKMELDISDLLVRRDFALPYAPIIFIGVLIPSAWLFWFQRIPSIEGKAFDTFFSLAFFMIYVALSYAFLRFVCIWWSLRHMLRHFARHKLFDAYVNMPGRPVFNLTTTSPTFTALNYSIKQSSELFRQLGHHQDQSNSDWRKEFRDNAQTLENFLKRAIILESKHRWNESFCLRRDAQLVLSKMSGQISGKMINWYICQPKPDSKTESQKTGNAIAKHEMKNQAESSELKAEITITKTTGQVSEELNVLCDISDDSKSESDESGNETAEKSEITWERDAEYFLAGRMVAYLHHMLAHLHNQVVFVTTGLLLMLLAVTSYPFQPSESLLIFNWMVILSVAATIVIIFLQMNHDKVISVLAGPADGKEGWNWAFISRILYHGVLPLLILLGTQFPELFRQIADWIGKLSGGGQ